MRLQVSGAEDGARAQSKRRREGRSTVTERVERSDTRTQERKDFSAMSVRQTVSYMDTIHVEEQLVHAFCEQPPHPRVSLCGAMRSLSLRAAAAD